jgi:predicted acyltransferase
VHEFLGSYACLVLAGAIAGSWLVAAGPSTTGQLALQGALLWVAGWLLRPLHGYHKLGATESWALVAAGQAGLILAGFHAGLDRPVGDRAGGAAPAAGRWTEALSRALDRPAQWLADAGGNALLAYLLSEIQAPLCERLGISLVPGTEAGGPWAVVDAALLTLLFVALAAAATRARVRLRL